VVNKVSYTLLNAKVMYNFTKNIRVYMSGENLLNTDYEVNRYYTMPGFICFAGINFTF